MRVPAYLSWAETTRASRRPGALPKKGRRRPDTPPARREQQNQERAHGSWARHSLGCSRTDGLPHPSPLLHRGRGGRCGSLAGGERVRVRGRPRLDGRAETHTTGAGSARPPLASCPCSTDRRRLGPRLACSPDRRRVGVETRKHCLPRLRGQAEDGARHAGGGQRLEIGLPGGAKKIEIGTVLGSRPARCRRSRSAGIFSTGFRPGRMIGIQPSQNSATRSKVVGPSPSIRIGGCGFCTGLG